MSPRHLGDGKAILEHLQDDPVALFHHVQLHKHEPGPSDGAQSLRTSGLEGGRLCQASGGRAAPSSISWTCGVKYLPDFYKSTSIMCKSTSIRL